MRRILLGLVVSVLVTAVGCNPVVVIQPREVGVVFNRLTGDFGEPLTPGTHLINPITDDVRLYSTALQQITLADGTDDPYGAVEVVFADGVTAELDITVIFAIDPEQVIFLQTRWQDRYVDEFVVPTVRGILREVAAQYNAEALIMTGLIDSFRSEMGSRVSSAMADEGLIVTDTILRNVVFEQAFVDRIERQILTATAEVVTPTPRP
jgi:regulator of protease activity HflC (stomatin/prohibitin superfamily)